MQRSTGTLPPAGAAAVAASVFVVPLLLSASTTPTPNHPRVFLWYQTLREPSFQPPDVAIPIAWTIVEAGLAVTAYRLLRHAPSAARTRAMAWWGANVIGIGAWSRLFFGARSLPASTIAAGALAASATALVVEARKVDKTAAAASVPLVAWVCFATVLTAAIWRRNR